mmetsp:Transcript_30426/g.66464  ORF Transcript_30426/g.66464 Transcript_30426/m.66464 type:complete len:189 (-) Transcript_30426:200-766(-)|eukprot:CAMPEP_0118931368 /NCGR_PEP_ID=MMETSP1169-20130426/7735_1 /TAXON_ID=36882 /ORGANISM="Pyramimonas obovata, Strain CCMP722" /LENGTH=188 /DNA_ID=CAMNT_0006873863 /DNA_START=129 /DNA_END=695 /DNA_ORIENTATION=+
MSKSATPKAKGKTTLDKIELGIRALKDPNGSSRHALVKYLKAEGIENATAIKKAFKTGVESGRLIQQGQSFKLPGVQFDGPEEDRIQQEDLKLGKEDAPEAVRGSTVTMKYVGTLESGEKFDAASKFTFTLGAGEVIKGWEKGVPGMRVGGRRKLIIPPKDGYGKRGSPPEIPPNATLVFDITLLAVE